MSKKEKDFEKEILIDEIIEIQNTKENYREQLTKILDDYIIFKRRRCHDTIE